MTELLVLLFALALAPLLDRWERKHFSPMPSPQEVARAAAGSLPPVELTDDDEEQEEDEEDRIMTGSVEELATRLGLSRDEFAEYLRSGRFGGGGE